MIYRPEVDGLRAVAVLSVMFFHAGFWWMPGGFLGVDVFFVISGYLITSIVWTDINNGSFSFQKFYERRIRRILPAYFAMLIFTSILGSVLMLPSQLRDFGQSLIASNLFAANIFFWQKLDYWGLSAELTPLVHLWSLGIEEQFYLVFPILLVALRNQKNAMICLLIIVTSSFIAMVYANSIGNVSESFYLLPFRAWELAAGAILVFIRNEPIVKGHKARELLSVSSLLVLLASFLIFNKNTTPYLLYGAPIVATCIMLRLCTDTSIVGRIIGSPLFVRVGVISYSLYLFHQPLLVFLRLYSNGNPSVVEVIGALAIAFVLSQLSYQLIEMPFRNRQLVGAKTVYAWMVVAFVMTSVAGTALILTDGLRVLKLSHLDPKTTGHLTLLQQESNERRTLWKAYLAESERPYTRHSENKVLIVGDSFSEDLYASFQINDKKMPSRTEVRRLSLDDNCIANGGLLGVSYSGTPCAAEIENFIGSDLLKSADVIIIANNWDRSSVESLGGFLSLKEMAGKRIETVVPHGFIDMTSIVLALHNFNFDVNSRAFKRFLFLNRLSRRTIVNRRLAEISINHGVSTIHTFKYFCQDDAHECSLFSASTKPLLIDQMHLSREGAREFAVWFWPMIEAR